ncbi:MAG: RNA-binding protein [Psychrilyobacter sp.]|nr:RNA-binding protein [Psychrilyobacter sp.]
MDKKKFENHFIGLENDLIYKIFDRIELCKKLENIVYIDFFVPPNIWSKLIDIENELGVIIEELALTSESEKKMLAFRSYYAQENTAFPVKFIKIEGNNKFFQLEHRHFLAGILSTGIKREKLGDIIVSDGIGYTVIDDKLYDFLQDHLLTIGKSKIKITDVDRKKIPSPQFLLLNHILSSMRLDVVVAKLINSSRSEALKLINGSLITVNYGIKTDKSFLISNGDIITIRKYGKFKFEKSNGETKKDKLKGLFKKYI